MLPKTNYLGPHPYSLWEQNMRGPTQTASEFPYIPTGKQRINYHWLSKIFSLSSSPFLKSSSGLVKKCFHSLSPPSFPMPLVQRSTKCNPLAQNRRSIIFVQIPGLRWCCIIRKAWVSPTAWIHTWRKGSTVETFTKSWAGQHIRVRQTHCQPSGHILAQHEPGSYRISLLPFTTWL